MCLEIVSGVQTALQKKFKTTDSIICYKFFSADHNGNLKSPTRGTPVFLDKHRRFVSNRSWTKLTKDEVDSLSVRLGIHVFVTKNVRGYQGADSNILLPVLCHKKDFVAAGVRSHSSSRAHEAVFTKITIPAENELLIKQVADKIKVHNMLLKNLVDKINKQPKRRMLLIAKSRETPIRRIDYSSSRSQLRIIYSNNNIVSFDTKAFLKNGLIVSDALLELGSVRCFADITRKFRREIK